MPQQTLPIQLDVITLTTAHQQYQTLAIDLPNPPITVSDMMAIQLPSNLYLNREVILFGQAPNWLYGRLLDLCREAPWIAVYNAPAKECVVVSSRVSQPSIGDTLSPVFNTSLCPAILVGGPPNSGKSVFSNAIRQALIKAYPEPNLFLYRANWDGEGNWAYETKNASLVDQLVQLNEFRIHEDPDTRKLIPEYFEYHARAVTNLRSLTDILIVDVGGLPQKEKHPLLEQCTHYIVISRDPTEVHKWHQFCQPYLKPIAVIHSVLEEHVQILGTDPFLEMVAGPWVEEKPTLVPQGLINRIASIFA